MCRGQKGVFSGSTTMKQLLWITLPVLILYHFGTIALVVPFGSLKSYFYPPVMFKRDKRIIALRTSVGPLSALMVGGISLCLVNTYSDAINGFDTNCDDPLVDTTVVPRAITVTYQWIFCAYGCMVLIIVSILVESCERSREELRCQQVHRCLMNFMLSLTKKVLKKRCGYCHSVSTPHSQLSVFKGDTNDSLLFCMFRCLRIWESHAMPKHR